MALIKRRAFLGLTGATLAAGAVAAGAFAGWTLSDNGARPLLLAARDDGAVRRPPTEYPELSARQPRRPSAADPAHPGTTALLRPRGIPQRWRMVVHHRERHQRSRSRRTRRLSPARQAAATHRRTVEPRPGTAPIALAARWRDPGGGQRRHSHRSRESGGDEPRQHGFQPGAAQTRRQPAEQGTVARADEQRAPSGSGQRRYYRQRPAIHGRPGRSGAVAGDQTAGPGVPTLCPGRSATPGDEPVQRQRGHP